MVLRELRMKDDVHQTAAPGGVMHFRYAAHRLRIELAVMNHAHAAFEFVYENASIRKEQEGIRILQSFRDRDDADFVITRIEVLRRGVHGWPGGLIGTFATASSPFAAL